jgi:hypothetical protein
VTRVGAYWLAQFGGAIAAAAILRGSLGDLAHLGAGVGAVAYQFVRGEQPALVPSGEEA